MCVGSGEFHNLNGNYWDERHPVFVKLRDEDQEHAPCAYCSERYLLKGGHRHEGDFLQDERRCRTIGLDPRCPGYLRRRGSAVRFRHRRFQSDILDGQRLKQLD